MDMKFIPGKCRLKFYKGEKLVSSLRVWIWICMVAHATADSDDGHDFNLVPVCNRMPVPDYPSLYIQQDGLFLSVHRCLDNEFFNPNGCGCMSNYQVFQSIYQGTVVTTAVNPPTQPSTTTTTTTTTPVPTTTTTTTAPTTTTAIRTTPPPPPPPTTTTQPTTRRSMKIAFFEVPVLEESQSLSVKRKITTPTPDRMCDGCTFDRGVGYNTHSEDCDKYVLCYPKGVDGHLTGEVRHCGVGQYWDPHALTCRPSKDINCPYERCHIGSGVDTYRYDADCRGYWKCQHGVSVGYCCPRGEAYKDGVGCVPDPSCDTPCDAVELVKDCDKTVVAERPWMFRQRTHTGFVEMPCPGGTVFSETSCRCQMDVSGLRSKQKVCKKEFDLEFRDGIRDVSGNGNYVDAFNVTYVDDLAYFDGDGALLLPRFANAEIGNHLVIRMRFKFANAGDGGTQALVFNGDCDQYSSIVITGNHEQFSLGLRSRSGTFKTMTMQSYPNTGGWYDVTFAYHNDVMSILQRDLMLQDTLPGGVSRSRCALKIGWGENYDSFKGCINMLSISFCPES